MFDFTVLILEGQFPTGVAVTRDVLLTAEYIATKMGLARPRWRLCSLDGGNIRLQGGFSIETIELPAKQINDRSVWITSGLGLNQADDVHKRLQDDDINRMALNIKAHLAQGGRVAAACSAVFLLQHADVLAQRAVTTTWWLAPLLQSMEPRCKVDADRMVCIDGQIITSGAAFAQTDLMVHLLRERFGSELVSQVSRMLLIDGRVAHQAPFIVPELLASGDELVCRITARIEQSLPNTPSVEELANEFCMSERTLARYIRKATGKSTIALIQSVRFRRAR
ncbi:MAG TPA: DJ-1/PfpI family protein, partial [Pseudomonadales bacterium]|nr:DJ-1/PfpI family protein [Pseudomonadales bacterium]